MTDEPHLTARQERILWALAAERVAPQVDSSQSGCLPNDGMAAQFGATEEEVRDDLRVLSALGFIEYQEDPLPVDPIGDVDTSPDTWLHAGGVLGPLAASQCYPLVFMILMGHPSATDMTVGDLTALLGDDNWPAFVADHLGIISGDSQTALEFLATEVTEQMLGRIAQRYPAVEGYSPVQIALVSVYRAMRAAHEEAAAR